MWYTPGMDTSPSVVMNEAGQTDFTVTLPFNVPPGDTDGLLTEALLAQTIKAAPEDCAGFVASADSKAGEVWVIFNLWADHQAQARATAQLIQQRVTASIITVDEAPTVESAEE